MTLQTHGLSYAYVPGKLVLNDISLRIDRGKVAFVLGANASGKTTLLECLCGVRKPTLGRVDLNGVAIEKIPPMEKARYIGFVPQVHEPVFAYTVGEVALMGRAPHLRFLAHPKKSDREEAERALKAVGLWELRDRPYTTTSGGERRLTLIARGLTQGVRCLLMDEPDAHLDPYHQHEILSMVVRLAREGFTFVVASHNPNNALIYGDWVTFLAEGELIAQGPPREVITPKALEMAYGMAFKVIRNGDGQRAVLPMAGNLGLGSTKFLGRS